MNVFRSAGILSSNTAPIVAGTFVTVDISATGLKQALPITNVATLQQNTGLEYQTLTGNPSGGTATETLVIEIEIAKI